MSKERYLIETAFIYLRSSLDIFKKTENIFRRYLENCGSREIGVKIRASHYLLTQYFYHIKFDIK